MTKAEFQDVFGPKWAAIVADPCFFAALQVCGSERLQEIENLSPEQIESHGKTYLAGFQGHLKTESILLNLAVESQADGFDLPPADYGVPETADQPEVQFPFTTQPKPKRTRKPR